MKKIVLLVFLATFLSCKTTKNATSSALYQVLTEQPDGGASIQFYEVLTEAKEIKMLLNDKNLKNKIHENDIKTCNFIILNSGYKNKGKNKIEIESIVEKEQTVEIKIKENATKTEVDLEQETVNPYLILKINSKKEIVFK